MLRKHDFFKFCGRSGADRRLLVEALIWIFLARSAILTIPFRWTARLLRLNPGEQDAAAERPTEECKTARRIGWAVKVVSARSPWRSTCLAQALAASGMLRRRRIPATLAMGVAKDPAGPEALLAHAWLTCGGFVLTGASHLEKYNVVAKFTMSGCISDQTSRWFRA